MCQQGHESVCGQYLHKGEKAYFQGRLQTRSFTGKDGVQKTATEIIAENMLMLGGGRSQMRSGAEEKRGAEETEAAIDQADQKAFDVDEIPF